MHTLPSRFTIRLTIKEYCHSEVASVSQLTQVRLEETSAMKTFAILLISLALVAYGESRVAGEPLANHPVPLSDLITKAQADIAKLGKELHANLNLPDEPALINTLKTHSTNFVNNVRNYVNKVSEEVKSKGPEIEKLWSNVKTTMNKAADDVAAQIVIAKDQVSELEAKFLKGVETMVKQSELAAQTINRNSGPIQEDVAKIAKKAVEMAVDATQQLNSQVQKYATGNSKPALTQK